MATTSKRSFYPALRGLFGDWVYFSCLMTMEEVANRLSFAEEIHKSEELSQWIQRQLKGPRSKEIAGYLVREDQRFFNSLVVAIYGGDPAWHGFTHFKAMAKDIEIEEVPDDVEASLGFLSFTGDEKMFAIDGQHRLAGMREALKTNPALGSDEVSLVLVAHKNTKAGMERTRRLFTTLNKTARPVGKGEIIALDENDVMAISTRYLVENNLYFGGERIRFVQSDNLPVDEKELTTIGNLYDVLKVVFTSQGKVKRAQELQTIRPESDVLKEYFKLADDFFDGLAGHFPPLKRYFSAKPDQLAKVMSTFRHRTGGHVLFRPVGLRVFAEIVAVLVRGGLDQDQALAECAKLPTELSKAPYRDVIWLPNGTMRAGGSAVCRRLLLYMLNRETRPQDLKKRLAKRLGLSEDEVTLPDKVV
jgi:DNA sulfur modification protein DndB